jgi:hypothetical protein
MYIILFTKIACTKKKVDMSSFCSLGSGSATGVDRIRFRSTAEYRLLHTHFKAITTQSIGKEKGSYLFIF